MNVKGGEKVTASNQGRKGNRNYMEEEQDLYWGMHFCNSRMFKTIARIQMYLAEQKEEKGKKENKKEEMMYRKRNT